LNTLLTWLGNRDISNMLNNENAAIATIATHYQKPFDRIVILANDNEEHWIRFEDFLKKRMGVLQRPFKDIRVHNAHIASPIDYATIAVEAEKWIDRLSKESDSLRINLTSGTPAMTVLSVLIGKGKANVEFVQSTPSRELLHVDVPIDFGSEYVKSASKNIAHLAASQPSSQTAFAEITALSKRMQEAVDKARRISASEVPALILGETGTGKEVMASAIHHGSLRASKPLKIVNCGALAPNLVDSTLFGHKKGAFTGADKDYPGLFEQADGGTLFLDEVGELSLDIQVKLLRALQQGEVTRLGDTESIRVDVRVIAATHRDLLQLIEQGEFREDLFYRLAVGIITIPALRHRSEDIPIIVEQLINKINHSAARHPSYISKKVSEKGMKFISEQVWRGNIRELWSTLNRAVLWTDSEVIGEDELVNAVISRPAHSNNCDVSLSYNDRVDIIQLTESYQKSYVEAALKASGNVKKHATQMLGLKDHQTLTNWMKRLDIDLSK